MPLSTSDQAQFQVQGIELAATFYAPPLKPTAPKFSFTETIRIPR
ncbi:Hypothetical protein Minf_1908 [Methylacidiphilum infernorum V4]|uniref:Uncharacterized protein n=1 Tax=Methylacidiphilum infernorum (isolate V4) TaxID=481448 RepID=B3DY10_METI4|nr:Hypothetical protein Minf_1908 [Methylacidiphilum infernorum V4]